jgi:membrane protein YqaA with SNARE-associated domain
MGSDKQHKYLRIQIKKLQRHTGKKWFAPLLGFLAALDNIVIVIPTDGLLISSSMLIPKKWLTFALSVTIGSMLGALLLASIVEFQGLPWIVEHYPNLLQTKSWIWSQEFFENYGLLFVFVVGLSPLMQQPAVILAALVNTPLYKLALVVFFGRLVKFLLVSYIASHSPKYLKKIWGMKGELDEVDIKL